MRASEARMRALPTVSTTKSRNPFAKILEHVEDIHIPGNVMTRCPLCGVPVDVVLGEPHHDPAKRTPKAVTLGIREWNEIPWPHPTYLKNEHGEFIVDLVPRTMPDGTPDMNGRIDNVMRTDIEYPEDHPYWEHVMRVNDAAEERLACPGAPLSQPCSFWIGNHEGPAMHATCLEECYCSCHYERCICPDPDLPVRDDIIGIVCSQHGTVYERTTTQGL